MTELLVLVDLDLSARQPSIEDLKRRRCVSPPERLTLAHQTDGPDDGGDQERHEDDGRHDREDPSAGGLVVVPVHHASSPLGEGRGPQRVGLTFLWPFFDKLIGLNHQTTTAQAWINGGNPTKGFLSGSVGFLSGFYTSIAGAGIVNWLFMIGLLAIGIALASGVAIRFAAVAGSIMLLAMWSASLPPSDDLFLDNHIVYSVLLIGLALAGAGNTLGLGRRWAQTSVVQRYPWLT